jgi:hypothetical protein
MTLPTEGRSSLRLAAMPMAAWPMRSDAGAKVSLDWDPGRTYSLLESSTSSPEMAKIFDEDQRVRLGVKWTKEYGLKIAPADRQRREKVRDLLVKGELRSGLDFERAAFIFQHGEDSQDFLLAHALALASLARGEKSASWIASVSLDRYLLAIGQPQVLGTQMNSGLDTGLRKPYDCGCERGIGSRCQCDHHQSGYWRLGEHEDKWSWHLQRARSESGPLPSPCRETGIQASGCKEPHAECSGCRKQKLCAASRWNLRDNPGRWKRRQYQYNGRLCEYGD